MKREVLIFVTFVALVCAGEIEDGDQKKRGAGKTTTLNAIPTGAQKQEYTYSIYPQTSSQNPPSPSYQSQVPNSFYPSQGSNQYYSSPNSAPESPSYPGQPQLNLIPPLQASSQFVPLNFVPNPGYQTKYQLVPTKSANGNIQVTLIPQSQAFPQSVLPYSQFFSPNPAQQVNTQGTQFVSSIPSQGPYVSPNYQQFNPYLGQASTMFLLAQPNPSLFNYHNNFLYQNPLQSLYNYYPTNAQAKYPSYAQPSSAVEYEKGPILQSSPKEDNEITSSSHNTEYISSDNSNYKNAYSSSRASSYSKL